MREAIFKISRFFLFNIYLHLFIRNKLIKIKWKTACVFLGDKSQICKPTIEYYTPLHIGPIGILETWSHVTSDSY